MNHLSFTSKRSSYEQLENDNDDNSSTSSSSSLAVYDSSLSPLQNSKYHHRQRNNNKNDENLNKNASKTSSAASAADHCRNHDDNNVCQFQYEMKHQEQSSSSSNKHRRRTRRCRRRRRQQIYCLATTVIVLSVIGFRRRHSSSSSTTVTKPIISHKERLPTFFSIHDGDDYLYALDNPLYIALEMVTFHNVKNDDDDDSEKAVPKITISPSTIRCHDESLRVTFSSNNDENDGEGTTLYAAAAVQDDDVLIFLCGDHEDQLLSYMGVQQYSDIIEAATMKQIRTTHELNIQQQQPQFGFDSSSNSQTSAVNNISSFVDNHEWFIPYMPMIRQPVCYFVLYRPRKQQQQPQPHQQHFYYSYDDSPPLYTDYDMIASSNVLYITSILEPSMIHLAGTANPTEMVVSFTTGCGDNDNATRTTAKMTPLVVYSRVYNDDDSDNDAMTNPPPPPLARTRLVVPNNDNAMTMAFRLQEQDDDSNDDDNNHEQQQQSRAVGTTTSYTAQDLCSEPGNITAPGKFKSPGLLHTVKMSNLIPNVKYQYRVGIMVVHGDDDEEEMYYWSDYFVFQAAPPLLDYDQVDQDLFEPFAYLIYGDQGCPREGWGQGAAWMAGMVTREVLHQQQHQQQYDDDNNNNNSSDDNNKRLLLPVRAVHHFGDLSYAQGNAHQWDEWFQMIQPMVARVPLHVAVGNHEYDYCDGGDMGKDPSLVTAYDNADATSTSTSNGHGFHPDWGNYDNDSGGECGVPTSKRFTMPSSSWTRSNGVFWYSHIFASVHTIVLSSENDLDYGSPQHIWLEQELSVAVNRTRTPWLVVEMHRPLYEGEAKWPENNVSIVHRQELEDLFFEYKVDVVFAGHYHGYHRACDGLYQAVCNQGGPLHLTIGTAGGLLDVDPLYENDWSVVLMENEYGYGRVSVHNRTFMHIEFVRAGAPDDPLAGQVLDDVWVQRERE